MARNWTKFWTKLGSANLIVEELISTLVGWRSSGRLAYFAGHTMCLLATGWPGIDHGPAAPDARHQPYVLEIIDQSPLQYVVIKPPFLGCFVTYCGGLSQRALIYFSSKPPY